MIQNKHKTFYGVGDTGFFVNSDFEMTFSENGVAMKGKDHEYASHVGLCSHSQIWTLLKNERRGSCPQFVSVFKDVIAGSTQHLYHKKGDQWKCVYEGFEMQ